MNAEPNRLIKASSPYLLQHAYNPVQWFEWGEEALQKAKDENKLILVSIGYSACHWCHVMERECFEVHEVAEVMNKHYVCIKVDREERPDIDQIYMLAIQLMTGSGGWPLNCICLPDQRPIYGGTYFKKEDWINVLLSVADMWTNDPDKARQYADRLTDGIRNAEKIIPNVKPEQYTKTHLTEIIEPWKRYFDMGEGGYNRAPKFPLPNNWQFMLRYSHLMEDDATHVSALLTLEKMAMGGIYDHVGGGFARYSVDGDWHVPHFEKMLYDNGQLISLYAEAHQYSKSALFKEIVDETVVWLEREMTAPEGLFYSALDADSEGVEGKFYVWDKAEFDQVLGKDAALLTDYFHVSEEGNWEEEQTNILLRKFSEEDYAEVKGISVVELLEKIRQAKAKLLAVRSKRVRPGLDDKCLTAWNGITIKGLAESAQIMGNTHYYDLAKKAADFILNSLKMKDGGLFRNFKSGKASIPGFLDDYAFMIEALLALYETDFDERWLREAKTFADYVLENFEDKDSPMLFYTAANGERLIARKHELMDNVIPASNSVMAQNLNKLGLLFDEDRYVDKAAAMLAAVHPQIKTYGSAYSNWAIQLLNEVFGINEIALTGADVDPVRKVLNQHYIPNKMTLHGTNSALPLLKDKQSIETKIYICRNKVCQLPVTTVEEALKLIN
ncbi:thioredoxin domain-containing protein [Pedobacter sp. MC2016-24]|uniref:thioredoxin domain-containing protein n=1 Tax=Pedobacter sp. MC2016-24 TaxID=2780090 RepID=UPI001881ADD0|nr:thioredoxin domain-containing protein [Pedobacter sp. MC2016-24]MBE9601409.1 thioredoxin domain-containing protein [Pedobacter sp. MC2016-24]